MARQKAGRGAYFQGIDTSRLQPQTKSATRASGSHVTHVSGRSVESATWDETGRGSLELGIKIGLDPTPFIIPDAFAVASSHLETPTLRSDLLNDRVHVEAVVGLDGTRPYRAAVRWDDADLTGLVSLDAALHVRATGGLSLAGSLPSMIATQELVVPSVDADDYCHGKGSVQSGIR